MDLLLKGLRWRNGLTEQSGDIRIERGIIHEIGENLNPRKKEKVAHYKNHFIYPGLINAHDHLEMNLYPKLGTPPYNNYVDWATDIYKPHQSPIKEIEEINIKDRLLWGGIKNLISGVTTVVHHNPWHRFLGKDKFPVHVLKKIAWAHSLALGKRIQKDFPKKDDIPFIIHAAEGNDTVAFSEILKLNAMGLVKRNTVLIHAIALSESDIKIITDNETSVVWCPASNEYMFNQTAPIQSLKKIVRVALGSDSTLTGSATLLNEMHFALQTGLADSHEIYNMVTAIPREIFNLPVSSITPLHHADFFITPIKKKDYVENLLCTEPADIALVVINGNVKLANADVDWPALKNLVKIQSISKRIDIDIVSLKTRINKKVESSILELNPLWTMIEI